ncbi:MAG: hypothetical protein FJ387_17750 [Verrucomicrobia bacterium]|nr:hypothetical protein [Verrucomicrobiota bacterium]
MKQFTSRLGLGLALAGLIALGATTTAAERAERAQRAQRPERPERSPGAQAEARGQQGFERMAEALKLSEEQKTKFREILRGQADKMRELRDVTDRAERQEKSRQIREEADKKIVALLNAEQKETWKKLREERVQRAPGQPGAPRREGAPRPGAQRGQRNP